MLKGLGFLFGKSKMWTTFVVLSNDATLKRPWNSPVAFLWPFKRYTRTRSPVSHCSSENLWRTARDTRILSRWYGLWSLASSDTLASFHGGMFFVVPTGIEIWESSTKMRTDGTRPSGPDLSLSAFTTNAKINQSPLSYSSVESRRLWFGLVHEIFQEILDHWDPLHDFVLL